MRFARSPGAGGSGDGATDTSAAVYGCRGFGDDLVRRTDLHDPAEVHDRDAVGDHPRERQVVGDEQVRQIALGPQVEHEPQQLRPDRDVEHADGLIGDDQLRPEHERAGDDDALALATRQLVRVAPGERLRRSETRRLERVEHALSSLRRLALAKPLTTSGSATKSKIVCFGFSVSYGSWKIIPIRRPVARQARARRAFVTSTPLKSDPALRSGGSASR